MISKNSKLILVVFLVFCAAGVFSLAGLSWMKARKSSFAESGNLKPSQLNFQESNDIKPQAVMNAGSPVGKRPEIQPKSNLSSEDQRKFQTFKEILLSKNDNDVRIDRELKNLSPEMHSELVKVYEDLPNEDRNSRGLVAFLIARDLKSDSDAEFLKKLYQETPCKSLINCASEAADDPHLSGVNQTTLDYPQLAGLYQLENKLQRDPHILNDEKVRHSLQETLREARQFPSDAVQKRAEELQKRFGI